MPEIEFEASCDNCGRELEVTVSCNRNHRAVLAMSVEPCSHCVEAADDAGHDRGHDEGYDEGYEKGFDAGRAEAESEADDRQQELDLRDDVTRDRNNAGDR